jgi:hypothetical protein
MGYFSVLVLIVCILCAAAYFRASTRSSRQQSKESLLKELDKSNRILGEIDSLLVQIRGLSERHDTFFDRYLRLQREVQALYARMESGSDLKAGTVNRLTYRAFTLKEQIQGEKEKIIT